MRECQRTRRASGHAFDGRATNRRGQTATAVRRAAAHKFRSGRGPRLLTRPTRRPVLTRPKRFQHFTRRVARNRQVESHVELVTLPEHAHGDPAHAVRPRLKELEPRPGRRAIQREQHVSVAKTGPLGRAAVETIEDWQTAEHSGELREVRGIQHLSHDVGRTLTPCKPGEAKPGKSGYARTAVASKGRRVTALAAISGRTPCNHE
jgi:hypothetical protein